VIERYMLKLTADHRRALLMLAECPDGCTESLLLANGVSRNTLADLILGGLATAKTVQDIAATQESIEMLRFKITEAGRRAWQG
jgi:hypothetical protein